MIGAENVEKHLSEVTMKSNRTHNQRIIRERSAVVARRLYSLMTLTELSSVLVNMDRFDIDSDDEIEPNRNNCKQ